MPTVLTETRGPIRIVTINRPEVRNAVDGDTALALYEAFQAFNADETVSVAILTGAGGNFCAGADLKAVAAGGGNPVYATGDIGPMGPTRLMVSKPVIAAIDGFAVAGGLELALWCDLRVLSRLARLGVFCRRFGVPLVDGGTVRLPRLIGASRAMDLILTGREIGPDEAHAIGLANYVVPEGPAMTLALDLAENLAAFPQLCLRTDRLSVLAQWSLSEDEALRAETAGGLKVIESGSPREGAARFIAGEGRSGKF
jgi:enoyl-CoA hydratase